MTSSLALFDFDGTITKRNTFVAFLMFALPWHRQIILLLGLPILFAGAVSRLLSVRNQHIFLVWLMRGYTVARLEKLGQQFSRRHLSRFIRPLAMDEIRRHKQLGHDVVVVTASYDFWIRPWCDEMGILLLASQLSVSAGVATGQRFLVCDGPEKARIVTETFDLSKFDTVYGYGDSPGDAQMLAMADHSHHRPFRA